MNENIDLRSDTVTQPSPAMRQAMMAAPVGDDVYGEDPTVNTLEERIADLLGKEAALFATSGTQSNLLGLLSHCQRGDEYIVSQQAHTYMYEGGGAAVLGSIQPQPLEPYPDGTMDVEKIRSAIKPDDVHFARTRLICVENTWNGLVLPQNYLHAVRSLANTHALRIHLDGARLFHAAVKEQVALADLCAYADSVSLCLSKGLGAPVGSLLCGPRSLIQEARHWRKMLGGGMRQAGMLAAAGLYALEHHRERLAEDHANAQELATGLQEIEALHVDFPPAQTNMVFVTLAEEDVLPLTAFLARRGIRIQGGPRIRLVVHLDTPHSAIQEVIKAWKEWYGKK